MLLTVLLTVALVNAMNFVDGLDGLAAGIGMIAAPATGVFAIGPGPAGRQRPVGLLARRCMAVVLAGACLGFLPHNFNPARIFMGDSGSMLIGVMLAAATTSASGRIPLGGATAGTDLLALFAPLIVLAAVVFVPLLDLLMAVVRRTRKGLPPFAPGQDAPAPPAAGDRPQPAPGGAADLPVGRRARVRRGRARTPDRRSVRRARSRSGIGLVQAVADRARLAALPATGVRRPTHALSKDPTGRSETDILCRVTVKLRRRSGSARQTR